MWAMDKSFFKELPELPVISRPDAKLTDEANRATLESLEVLKRIEMNTEYLIIVGRKSPYFSEGLDSPSLRQ